MIASARGYPIDLVMPANSTEERVITMRALGAKVILTPAEKGIEGFHNFFKQIMFKQQISFC